MMGLSRWLQERDLKGDLRVIESFDSEAKAELRDAVNHAIGLIQIKLGIPVHEILDSESYHVVENMGWGKAPLLISKNLRAPLLKQLAGGDQAAVRMYYGVSVVLHSVRAVMDYEFNQNKKLLFWCQKLWYEFSAEDLENIPSRFRPKS